MSALLWKNGACTSAVAVLLLTLTGVTGCGGDSASKPSDAWTQDESPADAVDQDQATSDQQAPECQLEGTYTLLTTEVLTGSCDIEIADDTLVIRKLSTGYALDFDSTSWDDPVASEATCTLGSDGPGAWLWNNVMRTRSIAITVLGDQLTAQVADAFGGTDSEGHTCNVTVKLTAQRTGPAPEGAAVGVDACGSLGCSSSRCVFGQELGCESGLCLFDTTAGFESFCTQPCATEVDCPEGFLCLEAYEGWQGAAEGFYCARWRAVCGNKVVEEGELCDDGNKKDGDGCSADCSSDESCGNGTLEGDEFCEQTHPLEWLPCSDQCQFAPPEGVEAPLPINSESVLAVSTGVNSFVLVASITAYVEANTDRVNVVRTTDGGATWAHSTIPPGQNPYLVPITLAASGNKVAVGLTDSSAAFYVAESSNGGASWSTPVRHEIPNAVVADSTNFRRLELALLSDGTLLAVVGKTDGLLVARRPVGSQQFSVVGSMEMCGPHGWTVTQLAWEPPRFNSFDGGGVQVSVNGSNVTVLASGTCFDGSNIIYLTQTIGSSDGGASFGSMVDLGLASGLSAIKANPVSPTAQGPAAVCFTGSNAEASLVTRCALGPDDPTAPWVFFDTPVPFPDPNYSPIADTIVAAYPSELLVAQNAVDAEGGHVYRTIDGGQTWSTITTGETVSFGRSIRRQGSDAAWLIEVSNNNDLMLTRLDLAQAKAEPRFYLFGDARLNDGSGMPWSVAWAEDQAGHAALGFSVPDPIRYWITVVRAML